VVDSTFLNSILSQTYSQQFTWRTLFKRLLNDIHKVQKNILHVTGTVVRMYQPHHQHKRTKVDSFILMGAYLTKTWVTQNFQLPCKPYKEVWSVIRVCAAVGISFNYSKSCSLKTANFQYHPITTPHCIICINPMVNNSTTFLPSATVRTNSLICLTGPAKRPDMSCLTWNCLP
jgi:hypothetical protein